MTRKELREEVRRGFERVYAAAGQPLSELDWIMLEPAIEAIVDGGMANSDDEVNAAVRRLTGVPDKPDGVS